MFDIGWPELLMVAVVLILVVGPKDLPPMLRSFGRTVKKYRGMANDFKGQFNDALEESELDELRQTVADAKSSNPLNQLTDAVKEVGAEINEVVDDVKPVKPWTPKPEEISEVARSVGKKKVKTKAATARKIRASKSTAPKKTTPIAKKTAVTTKKPTATKPTATKPAISRNSAAKPSATKTPSVIEKTAAKTPAATKTARKPRATIVKKTTTSTGKTEAK